ncbi:MAG: hypothetical protein E7452_02850 [Ruminococcaceae bacterium]|nr:hypothetical protein [Oscillospiraceae bacterium]
MLFGFFFTGVEFGAKFVVALDIEFIAAEALLGFSGGSRGGASIGGGGSRGGSRGGGGRIFGIAATRKDRRDDHQNGQHEHENTHSFAHFGNPPVKIVATSLNSSNIVANNMKKIKR